MKRSLLFFLLLLATGALQAQIKYEQGYIIDKSGNRTDVLILNRDWRDNPSTITYKTSEDAEVQTAGVEDISGFGFGDHTYFQSFKVDLDRSGVAVRDLTTTEAPIFQENVVFLKQLVDGQADLYYYREGVVEQFFFSAEGEKPKALISKRYLVDNKIAENNSFRQQLYSNLNCENKPAAEFREIEYSAKDLVDYFEAYNTCKGQEFQVFEGEKGKGQFNFVLKAGAQFSSISVATGIDATGAEFDFEPGLKVGLEFEYILPFNRNKWALFVEPTYQAHQVDRHLVNSTPYEFNDAYLTMDIQYLSIATGARHYFFLNNTSKLFFNAGVAFDTSISTKILLDRGDKYELQPELNEVTTEANVLFGLGYNYSSRLSVEARYYTGKPIKGTRAVLNHYELDWDSTINTFAIILGYRFL